MLDKMKNMNIIKRIRKSLIYSRMRQYFPMDEDTIIDDRDQIDVVDVFTIDWPSHIKKPKIGVVRDSGYYPKWTKYSRFLDHNSFDYKYYNIHANNWVEEAKVFDIILGFFRCEFWHLQEMQEKYHFLETFMGKTTYPSANHAILYENKRLEAHFAKYYGLSFANTYVTHDKSDALRLVDCMKYPFISKIVPGSGSLGVEMIHNPTQAKKVVEQAFSRNGRRTFYNSFRQKDYVYFQDYVPNDGYDVRAMVVGKKWGLGGYRKVLEGDFRASGMNTAVYRDLPEEPLRIGRQVNKIIKSPFLCVDMVHDLEGKYHIIEFSPTFQMPTVDYMVVDGVPGLYVFDDEDSFHFEAKRYWLHDLILAEFLLNHYLPRLL
jgi:glutathione synthase/RimK-type ligase-like ATP-grasp enzyme